MSLCEIVIPNTVKVSKRGAFQDCLQLTAVTYRNGLEEKIGEEVFFECTLLRIIVIPQLVMAIKKRVVCKYSGLLAVSHGDYLEEIDEEAFYECTWLQIIAIPPGVSAIKSFAFAHFHKLTMTVNLGDGLEKIKLHSINNCTSLNRNFVFPAVKEIYDSAFKNCTYLRNVIFCDEIGHE